MIFSEVVEPNKKKILVMLFYIYIFAILLTVVPTEPAKTLELSYGMSILKQFLFIIN